MKFVTSFAFSAGILAAIAMPTESLASSRILYNYETSESSQATRRYSGRALSPSLVEKVIELHDRTSGNDASEALKKKFNFLDMSNIRNCIDIGFTREASDLPVAHHPKVVATYICSPEKAVIAFHIDDSGKEALYIIDIDQSVVLKRSCDDMTSWCESRKDSDFADYRRNIQYFLSDELTETRKDGEYQLVRYYVNDPTWAEVLLKQILNPSSAKEDFLTQYGLSVKWCDFKCLAKVKSNLEEQGVYISRHNKKLFESNGYVSVTSIKPGSTADDLGCFPLGSWIPKTALYPHKIFNSLDEFRSFAATTGFQRDNGEYGMGIVRVIDVENGLEEKMSSNNSCKPTPSFSDLKNSKSQSAENIKQWYKMPNER